MKNKILKIKNIITVILIPAAILSLSLIFIFSPSKKISESERRTLKAFPTLSAKYINSGKFMNDFDDYSMDQFPFRDNFRKYKAYVSKYILLKKDNNLFYEYNGFLSKMEYPFNQKKFDLNMAKLNQIQNSYLKDSNCKSYFSIIPDKNYFLTKDSNHLSFDYKNFITQAERKTDFASFIDIFPFLTLSSFYKTDQHWKQETLIPCADFILNSMNEFLTKGLTEKIFAGFGENVLTEKFFGAYYEQAALKVKPDSLIYLTSSSISNAKVTSFNTGKPNISYVYDFKKGNGRDPYEFFLSGSDALLLIENSEALTDKELIIFRDSFGSSIAPLFIPFYKKITLIDLRYIQIPVIKNYVNFDSQDVLFLYSTLVLNN